MLPIVPILMNPTRNDGDLEDPIFSGLKDNFRILQSRPYFLIFLDTTMFEYGSVSRESAATKQAPM